MPSILTHLSTLAMAWVLSGCYAPPESMVALSEPGEGYDQRLIGVWNSVDEDGGEAIYLQILPGEQTSTLNIIGVATFFDPEAAEPVYWLTATAYASRINGHDYYNVRRVAGSGFDYTAEGERPGFIFLKAALLNDATLNLCPMYAGDRAKPHSRRPSPRGGWPVWPQWQGCRIRRVRGARSITRGTRRVGSRYSARGAVRMLPAVS